METRKQARGLSAWTKQELYPTACECVDYIRLFVDFVSETNGKIFIKFRITSPHYVLQAEFNSFQIGQSEECTNPSLASKFFTVAQNIFGYKYWRSLLILKNT
jgi:hypothetical protein